MDPLIKELLNYSVLGIVVIGLSIVVKTLYHESKSKEEKWNNTIQGNTDVLHEIKRILERK